MTWNASHIGPKYLIIPAAGRGTRMKGVYPDLPKELIPLCGCPAILFAVNEGISAGIKDIIIIISSDKEIIRRYFEDDNFSRALFPNASSDREQILHNSTLTFLYQEEPLGESDAIGYAEPVAGGYPVAVIHPDDIYLPAPGVLKELAHAYSAHGADVLALMEMKDIHHGGISNSGRVDLSPIDDRLYRIRKFLPKGDGQFVKRFEGELRTCGMSVSGPHIFDYIERLRSTITSGEFTNVPVFTMSLKERGLLGYLTDGVFFDIGNPEGYRQCQSFMNDEASRKKGCAGRSFETEKN